MEISIVEVSGSSMTSLISSVIGKDHSVWTRSEDDAKEEDIIGDCDWEINVCFRNDWGRCWGQILRDIGIEVEGGGFFIWPNTKPFSSQNEQWSNTRREIPRAFRLGRYAQAYWRFALNIVFVAVGEVSTRSRARCSPGAEESASSGRSTGISAIPASHSP
jgi:hypothetical protein